MYALRSAHNGNSTCISVVRSMSSLRALLGAPPEDISSSMPDYRQPPTEGVIPQHPESEQPGLQLPSLCGEPKNKLSLHRRSNRRISYYSKRTELFAHCKHCGVSGMPHQWFAANNQRCTGQCLKPPAGQYSQGYKPPC